MICKTINARIYGFCTSPFLSFFFFFCNITMILSATCNALREVITPKIVPRLCRFKSDLAFHGEVSVVLSWNKRLGCALKRGENILHGNYTNCFTCKISDLSLLNDSQRNSSKLTHYPTWTLEFLTLEGLSTNYQYQVRVHPLDSSTMPIPTLTPSAAGRRPKYAFQVESYYGQLTVNVRKKRTYVHLCSHRVG